MTIALQHAALRPPSATCAGALQLGPADSEFGESFGACLIAQGLVDAAAVSRARRAADAATERLDHVLVKLGLISESDLAAAYAAYCGLPLLAAEALPNRPLLADRLKLAFLKSNRVMPVACTRERLTLAVVDPFIDDVARAIGYLTDLAIELVLVTPAVMQNGFRRLYDDTDANVEQDVERVAELMKSDGGDLDIDRLRDIANEAPVIRLVNQIIARAVEGRASDIHIEPHRDAIAIRYRVDGFLRHEQAAPAPLRAALTTRIKIMAQLDIAERRLPQDGRIKTAVRGVEIDIRIATMPTVFGESIVMRILDRTQVELDFEKLGLAAATRSRLQQLLSIPHGIVLTTGPTGSGKTTTLYSALKLLNRPELKVFTVEDPVEYQLHGINQIQVQPQIGFDFPVALRSILRQDPDVIMIGEIRDIETARIAIQASLTGHLVLTTLHTNGALEAISRLVDLGLERFLLASTVSGVMAQRLVRRLCRHCARPHANRSELAHKLNFFVPDREGDLAQAREAVGCDACGGTGYSGRTMTCELLVVDEDMREMIGRRSEDRRAIETMARRSGFRSLMDDGAAKVLAGETTFEEILRVTRMA